MATVLWHGVDVLDYKNAYIFDISSLSETTDKTLTVVVIGLGQMGHSHALAYHRNPGFQIIGLIDRLRPGKTFPDELKEYSLLSSFEEGLALKPDVVSINIHTASHADYAVAAMESGAHVFVEKPLAVTVADAERVVNTAQQTNRKLVIGYILRHHPSWIEFIQQARHLGPPFVMRMNLNQRSSGDAWAIHQRILHDVKNPIIDCGVHYVDVMLQITDSKPVQVRGMGLRLSDDLPSDQGQVNYGHLQILFSDGSVGWYEVGWGPMMSETAYFVKDIIGPRGSVSIVMDEGKKSADNEKGYSSANINSHTRTSNIRVSAVVDGHTQDKMLSMHGEPDHYELCAREQQFLLDAIREGWDLSKHMQDAVKSLGIVLAADRSMRENRAIDLE
ncbi:oxidoreductase, putative [Talaromyces stipitatus ATCC 10500]|uniref:Oxidoreductase, putative n=1 Tax=Talaromyces stipitatus (strain ATCC 10500 / CBS 375.48 / QM 6759 / NRRL 1006) TaxID=441959 RepID=B8LXI1_TALSN|nr:oxidoreductase, putative [Talaromyces stipitatus ATCC 10500]EED24482.1 oxidoreductase, putative [Talaromyces stipitatus ATCC 10500]